MACRFAAPLRLLMFWPSGAGMRQARRGAALDYLLLEKLRQRRSELRKIIKKKEASVKKEPAGRLKCARRKNSLEYYWKAPGAGRYSYIPKKNRRLAAVLAQKSYDEKILRLAREEEELVSKLIRICESDAIDAAYNNCAEGRKLLIEPVTPSDDEFREQWKKQESCLLGFEKSDPEFYTKRGERVRSKSEILIANTLFGYGVEYLFECRIELPGYGDAYPDFCVLDIKNRRTIVWEHLGKMGDSDYVERNLRKINAYLKAGYVIGETLILTLESASQPISTALIEKTVRHYFL